MNNAEDGQVKQLSFADEPRTASLLLVSGEPPKPGEAFQIDADGFIPAQVRAGTLVREGKAIRALYSLLCAALPKRLKLELTQGLVVGGNQPRPAARVTLSAADPEQILARAWAAVSAHALPRLLLGVPPAVEPEANAEEPDPALLSDLANAVETARRHLQGGEIPQVSICGLDGLPAQQVRGAPRPILEVPGPPEVLTVEAYVTGHCSRKRIAHISWRSRKKHVDAQVDMQRLGEQVIEASPLVPPLSRVTLERVEAFGHESFTLLSLEILQLELPGFELVASECQSTQSVTSA